MLEQTRNIVGTNRHQGHFIAETYIKLDQANNKDILLIDEINDDNGPTKQKK